MRWRRAYRRRGKDKFCLVEDPVGGGGGLKRVRALRHITMLENGQEVLVAQRGDLGGWVEDGTNLSVEGSAWVGGDARVFGGARVEGDALVTGSAEVSGGAVIRDEAQVSGRARVFDGAQVSGGSRVLGAAVVCSEAEVYGKAVVSDQSVVCGKVPRVFSLSAWSGAGKGVKAERMVAWVQGWSEVGMEPIRQRRGLSSTGAHVFGDAAVSGQAWVFEQAKVFGQGEISDQARVYEHAQVFDNSRVSDNASVFGRALVFSEAASEFVSGTSNDRENEYTAVFSPGDVARVWWTESNAHRHHWAHPKDYVRDWLEQYGLPTFEEWKDHPEYSHLTGSKMAVMPTSIVNHGQVFGSAKVWGESSILGTARIEGWVSGGSRIVGDLCQDYWLNDITHISTDIGC